MDHFHYRQGQLHCEEVALDRIAAEVGTPFYCYSEATLRHHLAVLQAALAPLPHRICYSVKANGNLALLSLLAGQGAGFDIVSGGELERVRRVGCPGARIVFSGVGKSEAEIRAALEYGILMFNVESEAELSRLARIAGETGKCAPVALRINPDVDPKTHPHISTGLKSNKFGIPVARALSLYFLAAGSPHLEMVGIDCHIGSQITELAPFAEAVARMRGVYDLLRREGLPIRYLDMGGGLGIPYRPGQTVPAPEDYVRVMAAGLAGTDLTLIVEFGRMLVGNAGVLVTRVEYVKEGEEKRFVITDAGMNDLMRPALYNAHHEIWPVRERDAEAPRVTVDVVGPICESADHFARDRALPLLAEGELLAVRSAGAYGFTMSSTYNSRPRPAEVLVRGDRFAIVRTRETIDQLLENERGFPEFP